jgi:hypothetical protein
VQPRTWPTTPRGVPNMLQPHGQSRFTGPGIIG